MDTIAEMSQEPLIVNKPRGRGRGRLGNQNQVSESEMPQESITLIRRSTRLNNATIILYSFGLDYIN